MAHGDLACAGDDSLGRGRLVLARLFLVARKGL